MAADILGIGITGPVLTDLERKILRYETPYAVVLFGRNVSGVDQLRGLCDDIKRTAARPPLLMIDEEGGRVDRLRNLLPGFPSAEAFLEGDDPEKLAAWTGRLIGLALRYFDIEVNLAPVVDVRRETPVRGLERRCFGADPDTVIHLAGAFMRAHQQTGTAACLKHFPGIGMGSGDPHYGATVIPADIETLLSVDAKPYFALANEAAAVMIGHGSYPAIDARRPASLSHAITTDLLRNRIGFDGIVVSDDMEMHAVSDLGTYEDITEAALMAGNDVILFCSQIEAMPDLVAKVEERMREKPALRARVEQARARCERYREHVEALRAASSRPQSFEQIEDEMKRFCDRLRETRHADQVVPEIDRRHGPRSPGTGKSGREEWT